jgi:lysophospholipase L1-like esterase
MSMPRSIGVLVRRLWGRRWVQRLSLFLWTLIVVAVVSEAALRTVFRRLVTVPSVLEEVICTYDEELGWRGVPGASMVHSGPEWRVEVKLNGKGFRSKVDEYAKAPGRRRIVVLGDSYALGYGVSEEAGFASRLDRMLGDEVEVVDLGMSGYSTDQEFLLLEREGVRYDPDLVIVALYLNDVYDNLLRYYNEWYGKPRFVIDREGELRLTGVPVPRFEGPSSLVVFIRRRCYSLCDLVSVGRDFKRLEWFSLFDRRFAAAGRWEVTERLLEEIARVAEGHGARTLFVVIPMVEQIDARAGRHSGIAGRDFDLEGPQEHLSRFAARAGIEMIDLLPLLRQEARSRPLYYRADNHWNEEGHRIAAQAIAPAARRALGLISP